MIKKIIISLIIGCAAFWRASFAQSPFEAGESLKKALSGSERIERRDVELTEKQKQRIAQRLGENFRRESAAIYMGKSGEKIDLFSLIVDERGKHGPITFIVTITPEGKVSGIRVLESVEVKGAKIGGRRFLRQFIGKSLSDPIKLNRDIDAITGATVSSAAAARAVRKALIIWEESGFKPGKREK